MSCHDSSVLLPRLLTGEELGSDAKWDNDYCIPDPESNMYCRTPGYNGAVPGGDTNGFSTTMMYDSFNENGNW